MEIFETFIIGPMTPWGPVVVGLFGLFCAFVLFGLIMKYPEGNAKVAKIGEQIHLGAKVFMITEYKILLPVLIALVLACGFSPLGWNTALAIGVGALSSAIAGFIGMYSATKANVRTATAAEESGQERALSISFFGGSIMGLCVASMGLVGLGGLYVYFVNALTDDYKTIASALEGFGVGASAVALFSRVGGGIYTKSADVGADLVGKIEAGIPEDDPRNPAVIADNVGDNVGDCAGMAADLFETYAVTIVATMVLSSIFFVGDLNMMIYPLSIGAACLLTSIVGTFFVKLGRSNNVMNALYKGFVVSAVASLVILWPVTDNVIGFTNEYTINDKTFNGMDLYYCGVIGLVITGLLIWITEYYTGTSYRPVKSVALSSTTGHGTNVIQGLAVSMEATEIGRAHV